MDIWRKLTLWCEIGKFNGYKEHLENNDVYMSALRYLSPDIYQYNVDPSHLLFGEVNHHDCWMGTGQTGVVSDHHDLKRSQSFRSQSFLSSKPRRTSIQMPWLHHVKLSTCCIFCLTRHCQTVNAHLLNKWTFLPWAKEIREACLFPFLEYSLQEGTECRLCNIFNY